MERATKGQILKDAKKIYREARSAYRQNPQSFKNQARFVLAGQALDLARGKDPRPSEPPEPPVSRRV